jgi:biopolymer transport protein ExbD
MIDVVFLLLVFFMLASQFGVDRVLKLGAGGSQGAYSGPPRLVRITADGPLLNGTHVTLETLADRLRPLVRSNADTIVLQAATGASYQGLMDVASALSAVGFTALAVVE